MSEEQDTPYSTKSILSAIIRKKWMYLILISGIYAAALLFLRYRVLSYSSTATVSVIDAVKNDIKTDRNLPDYLLPTDQLNAVFRTINSWQMEEHLIKRFKLYQHYGIDTMNEFHHGQVLKRLRASISWKKTPYGTIDITVRDPYRYVAYEMANEIASYSDTLNRMFILKAQAKRVALHRKVLIQLEDHLLKKQLELSLLAQELSSGSYHTTDHSVSTLNERIYNLSTAVDQYSQSLREEIILLETISENNLPTVVIQQRAIPDSQSLLLPSSMYALLFAALFGILILSYHYFRLRYSDYLKLFS